MLHIHGELLGAVGYEEVANLAHVSTYVTYTHIYRSTDLYNSSRAKV